MEYIVIDKSKLKPYQTTSIITILDKQDAEVKGIIERLEQKLEKIKEICKSKTKEDICIECKCFENGKECFGCDYEEHRNELYNENTAYNLGLSILQIIGETYEQQ